MVFSQEELERYARHVILPEIGGAGQQKLKNARVLVIGAGGLGSPMLLYLAAAGVGTIGIVDDDTVSLSNLQRQVAHDTTRIGTHKTESAAIAVASLNPHVRVIEHTLRLTEENAEKIFAGYDIVADGSDNFDTRFLVNDTCYRLKKTLVTAAILRFDGQLSTFKAHLGAPHPCYRCVFPEPPPPGSIPACSEAGVLGALGGVMGSLQALEVVKEILDLGDSLSGRLMLYDALRGDFRTVRLRRDPHCRTCGH
ncbi:molybdopterin-synthase adenylyltransferase MoeB [uncultured Ferrovibrio sp.]|jgi:molybdopterin/thiamine biosynthesis adenylyltransferase|uniref:HesA/MoeB/ThiF family protein n=1 Tax=uncultured Ferrovibrio sp. TaxID=1576913 RepID=UPI002628B193|nr:molybdopterin-synthase adenylyltransferase MoeB [uncultured Ferrovibrio sp.]